MIFLSYYSCLHIKESFLSSLATLIKLTYRYDLQRASSLPVFHRQPESLCHFFPFLWPLVQCHLLILVCRVFPNWREDYKNEIDTCYPYCFPGQFAPMITYYLSRPFLLMYLYTVKLQQQYDCTPEACCAGSSNSGSSNRAHTPFNISLLSSKVSAGALSSTMVLHGKSLLVLCKRLYDLWTAENLFSNSWN